MIRARFAGSLLAAGLLAASTSCAPATPRAADRIPVTAVTTSQPPSETLSPLLEQALPNVKGKTFTSTIVSFPPAARAAPHRHGEAFVYAYVLAGTVRSRLGGEPVRTYRQGENWVELPGAHHVLTENTSRTQPAKLLVIFVSDTGAQLKIDD
ncbi:cupin domain-containing protein [Nonomuraea sp. FMUSA5-5]|uniref:Cupin domain-containing protein n=1 Tax=Nonomuraea composti TaxID=2720023 RepID=A0ABX1ATC9_9ACTN|nr:cupin domain-containing protein [Nonomuraea sp. FMUSA5-5]NJP88890.1 cupin domain-containing protein [Nonomuraea sp. FMUSA5-5]